VAQIVRQTGLGETRWATRWRRVLGWGGAIVGAVLVGSIPSGTAHQPITTQVMFNREVIRILERNCLSCHSPGQIKADIPLTTYRQARPWAKAIKEEVLERRMVPFQVVKGYGEFRHSYSLAQREQELLLSWIEGGAPKGDEKDYPQASIRARLRGEWVHGREPDRWFPLPEEIRIPAGQPITERCLVLEAGNNAPVWAQQFNFQPGNGEVVSRAEFYLVPRGKRGGRGGNPCLWPVDRLTPIGHWVPGAVPTAVPAGMGYQIPAAARLVVRLRYQGIDRETTDRSRFGWHLLSGGSPPLAVDHQLLGGSSGVSLEAGAHQQKLSRIEEIAEERQAIALRPFLFPYASSLEVTLTRPNGTREVLLVARGYRYDWQPAYYFKRPILLPRGSQLTLTAYLDNSEENQALGESPRRRVNFRAPLLELISAPTALPSPSYSN
jgi:hypothetical protein